jgi:endonuclease/exonuclease/phosphatase family metal-dependent hydrolase
MLAAMRNLALLLAPLTLLGCGSDDGPPPGPGVPIKVMTRNLYLGADLIPVVTAMTLEEIPTRVAGLWRTMQASDLPGRAKLLAEEIATAKPDLVGLQEAVIFYKQTPGDFTFANPLVNADKVELDFVQLLLAELAARGSEYVTAATLVNTDVEFPAADDVAPFDVRMKDRNVILSRKDLPVLDPQARRYPSHLKFTVPFLMPTGAPVDLVRGVVYVKVIAQGAPFVFATTHLEVSGGGNDPRASMLLMPLQEAQAVDLVEALKTVAGPVVLVGDFNSPAGAAMPRSYNTITGAFTDAFAKTNPGMPGFTCCTEITAPAPMPTSRIDLVFFRGGVTAQAVELVGLDPTKRSPMGLWASDHAGVVASLEVPGPPK